ncbi:uncharacterized protein LOC129577223 isoform X3 [Sitodiplosis mosellana]|uniref:uncharacterized protein LOC129577223 isoform X3 n=1 Tax=Sitodiplosis mosellana TaxID=263140 RepID=UPI002444E75C|nr:uncharacterized protein LOC129577223 isoform X3 [Sitodiplosis mosellana]
MVTYLGAFSCEVSWILEAHGDLPIYAYLLCSGYFIMFVASTILIHGLATGLSWGLFSWSIVVGVLSIPELIFVMIMTTQFWGLQSIHGMTEIITYLIRLVINSMALLCVIPTALRWRRERQIMSQLENLATRLHMTSPDIPGALSPAAASAALTRINDSMQRRSSARKRRLSQSGYDNHGFIPIIQQSANDSKHHQPQITLPIFPYMYGMYPSQNEFNASIFGLDPSQIIGPMPTMQAAKRTQSLLDFRHILPSQIVMSSSRSKTPVTDLDAPDGISNTVENQQNLNNNIPHNHPSNPNNVRESNRKTSIPTVQNKNFNSHNEEEKHSIAGDPIYQTISSEKGAKLGRNCISLENLRTLTIKNDLNSYGNNLLQNHGQPSSPYYVLPAFPPTPTGYNVPHYFNPKPHHPAAAHYMFGPPFPMQPPPHMMAPPPPPPQAYFHQNYRMPFTNYGGYANPNPYSNLSNTNSRQSIGNDSDDYRKYRDVAL